MVLCLSSGLGFTSCTPVSKVGSEDPNGTNGVEGAPGPEDAFSNGTSGAAAASGAAAGSVDPTAGSSSPGVGPIAGNDATPGSTPDGAPTTSDGGTASTSSSPDAGTSPVDPAPSDDMMAAGSMCPAGQQPTDEACDGIDNDCDGMIDEELAMECGSSMMGICLLGSQVCLNGVWGDCEGAVEPGVEVCDPDKLDENCDGTPNEGCECTEGEAAPCGKNVGACREGMQVCTGGKLGECEGATDPESRETCEGSIDEDCDDKTDEGCDCTNGESEPCVSAGACTPGMRTCSNGKWGECRGSQRCTGGKVCDTGASECVDCLDGDTRECGESDNPPCRMGSQRCTNNRWESSCQGAVLPKAEDSCNGLDDDCNGRPDDGCDGSESCMEFNGEAVCAERGPTGPYARECTNCIKLGNVVQCESCNGGSAAQFQLPCNLNLVACGGKLLCLPAVSEYSLSMCTNVRLSNDYCTLSADCTVSDQQTNTISSSINVADCTDGDGQYTGLGNCGGWLRCNSAC